VVEGRDEGPRSLAQVNRPEIVFPGGAEAEGVETLMELLPRLPESALLPTAGGIRAQIPLTFQQILLEVMVHIHIC
jgi:hypothetical protein